MNDVNVKNPVIPLDYPDPDVIRVEDTYYMVTTTMHFMPGCEILRSYDLVNWEHACYVYDKLDSTDNQKLVDDKNIYGKGMWAASLRYHNDSFYVVFAANDTQKTYLYTTSDINKPWKKDTINGFYHDASLLFDDDGKVYIVYGNTDIWLTELEEDLSGPKEHGLHRLLVSEKDNDILGYEGAHIQIINNKYYLFLIHSLPDRWMRAQACFVSDSVFGEFKGGDILIDDRDYLNQGVAQGGIVDTPDGEWYTILFQDHGAVGRLPILIPVSWNDDFLVLGEKGKIQDNFSVKSTKKDYDYFPLVGSDDFTTKENTFYGFKPFWQFNHEPNPDGFKLNHKEGLFELTNTSLSKTLTQSPNTLTQRMLYPSSSAEITLDISDLKEGDVAGICALQAKYAYISVVKEEGNYYVVMRGIKSNQTSNETFDEEQVIEHERVKLDGSIVTLKVVTNFENGLDEAYFFYKTDANYKQLGTKHKLIFDLNHFVGSRYGLFNFSEKEVGGIAKFSHFKYSY